MIEHYELVLNVKISITDIFFNAILVFWGLQGILEQFSKTAVCPELVRNTWKSIFFLKIQVYSKGVFWLPPVAMLATQFHLPSPSFLQKNSAAATSWVASCPVFKSERFLGNLPALYDFVSVGILIWSTALASYWFWLSSSVVVFFFKLLGFAFTLKKILKCSLSVFRCLLKCLKQTIKILKLFFI